MPFTFSHPAVVLPFERMSKKWISFTGVVIGSMTPDFEYFIRMKVLSKYSHTWIGLFWYDVPLGIILTLLYNNLVKDALIDHLPAYFNKRFSVYRNTGIRRAWYYYIFVLLFSVLIGAVTHILWDSFTHPMGYFVLHIHKLKQQFSIAQFHFRLYNIMQQFSSLAGAAFITIAVVYLPAKQLTKVNDTTYYWLILLITCIAITVIRLLTGLSFRQYGDVIVTAISGMLIGLITASISSAYLKV